MAGMDGAGRGDRAVYRNVLWAGRMEFTLAAQTRDRARIAFACSPYPVDVGGVRIGADCPALVVQPATGHG